MILIRTHSLFNVFASETKLFLTAQTLSTGFFPQILIFEPEGVPTIYRDTLTRPRRFGPFETGNPTVSNGSFRSATAEW